MIPEECTTSRGQTRHLSVTLAADPHVPGRTGRSLCGSYVEDEAHLNAWRRWHGGRIVTVARLRPCPSCPQIAARLARDVAS